MSDSTQERERKLAERERALADARAALRHERDAIAAERAEVKRLVSETRAVHRSADRERSRARRLASRFARKLHTTLTAARAQLDADRKALTEQVERLNKAQSEFQIEKAEERDRLRAAWADLEARQKRIVAEWDEANRHFADQSATLKAQAAALNTREKSESDVKAQLQRDVIALREEAAGLEVRVRNARQVVDELERQREQLRAETLALSLPIAEPPEELTVALDRAADRDLTKWAAELAQREEQLNAERSAVAAVHANVLRDAANLADQRRVLAEQFAQLASARARWQETERSTVVEMEQLARTLRLRESELDARNHRLIRADSRRREDAAELWQLRLRLEAWQSKLVAFEMRWHTEREELEADFKQREQSLIYRQTVADDIFARWERERVLERTRLTGELDRWSADRDRMISAAEAYDSKREEVMRELTECAARAMAAEEFLGETLRESKSDRVARRLVVLRTRWEKHFERKLREVTDHRAMIEFESNALDARYRDLQELVKGLTERVAIFNARGAALEHATLAIPLAEPITQPNPNSFSPELAALRDEVERMASVLLETELPEPPDPPDSELPWGADEALLSANDEEPLAEEVELEVLPFESPARAA
ncbi:MAG: hypothetical protein L0241_22500 [Planctomycetia bacterium]|nr:hypothetical protein [Planctomycetia bacterium]